MSNNVFDNFEPAAKIVVIGVGGAGNNAVNRMIDEEIQGVTFYVVNTDKQALATSKSLNRIILGESLTGGLGAGGEPEIGEQAAQASADEIKEIVKDANMVFIAAGMGGGTGTGAAPVIAKIAKDAGALVVAIVTRPFSFEGSKKIVRSIEGLNKLKKNVDSIIVVSNDKLLMMDGNLPVGNAFGKSDGILAQSVKTVVNMILIPAVINTDFADVRKTLENSGLGLIGFGLGSGPNGTKDAANAAINSPLLEASITGAKKAIVTVTCGPKVSLFEAQNTVALLTEAAGGDLDIKFGLTINDQLNDEIFVSIIASHFENDEDFTEEKITSFVPKAPINQVKVEEKKVEVESNPEDDILPGFIKNLF